KDRPVYARFKTYNLRIGSVQGREAVARRTRRADAGEVVLPRLDQVAETKISRLVRGLGQRHFRPYAVKGRDIVVEVHQFQPIRVADASLQPLASLLPRHDRWTHNRMQHLEDDVIGRSGHSTGGRNELRPRTVGSDGRRPVQSVDAPPAI